MHEDVIPLAEFDSEFEAQIARGHLRSAGIDGILAKDDAGGMLPSLQGTEGVSLLVLPEDMKKAKAILHEKSTVRSVEKSVNAITAKNVELTPGGTRSRE